MRKFKKWFSKMGRNYIPEKNLSKDKIEVHLTTSNRVKVEYK